MSLFDDAERGQLEKLIVDLTSLYRRVKSYVIASENITDEHRLSLPAINEFRNAFDHLMRVTNVLYLHDARGPVKAQMKPLDYCASNLSKAMGHVYRAGYDALEVIALTLLEEIDGILQSIRRVTLIEVIPNYSNEVTAKRDAARRICDEARASKDIESTDVSGQYFAEYESAIEELKSLSDLLNKYLPDLREVDKEKDTTVEQQLAGVRTQRNWAVVGAVIGLIGVIITILIASF